MKEATGNETTEEMVQTIVDDFQKIMKLIKTAMDEASQVGDDRTEDMLNATFQSLEKNTWMLSAFLGK